MPRMMVGLVKQSVATTTANSKGCALGASFALQFAEVCNLALAPALV